MARAQTTGETATTFEHWPLRSQSLKAKELVVGWPSDKWEGYRHQVHRDQIDRAAADPLLRTEEWLIGKRSDVPGFLIHGPVGRGKTAVALLLALKGARRGCSAQFVTAETVVGERSSTGYSKKEGETQSTLRSRYMAPQILILDDVCAKQYSGNERAFILELVRGRQAEGKQTHLTTNLELNRKEGGVYVDRAKFESWLDGRVLSTYKGWAIDASAWGPSLRGRYDENAGGRELQQGEQA